MDYKEKLNKYYNSFYNFSKIFYKNFLSSDISLLASNLTYMMILTIFPFFAIVIGVSKGFGLDEILISELTKFVPQDEVRINYVLNVINNLIVSAKGGVLTGLGIIILVYSVISMFDLLEKTFNNIWNVKDKRKYSTKIISYVAITFIAPIFLLLIIGSSSVIVDVVGKYLGNIAILTLIFVRLINITLILLVLLALFLLVPNKRVQLIPAFIGSLFTLIGIYVIYVIYSILQTSINRYNIIYGSLAFVPIFLIWIKYIWTVILIGAQITYSIQTSKEFVEEKYVLSVNETKKLGLYLLYIVIENFENMGDPFTINDLKNESGLPKSIIKEGIRTLQDIYLLNEFFDSKTNQSFYQVNKNPNAITIKLYNDLVEKSDVSSDIILEKITEDKKEKYLRISKEIDFKNIELIKEIK
ncbi:MAG: YihY/virulence factor BrkB family protein [Streptobacillus sp.]|jgi:yihY family protein